MHGDRLTGSFRFVRVQAARLPGEGGVAGATATPRGNLLRRYVWRGDAGNKVAATTQLVTAILAIVAAVLGTVGAEHISSSFFRAMALAVGAVVLLAQLVAYEQWHGHAETHGNLPALIAEAIDRSSAAPGTGGAGVREVSPAQIEAELRDLLWASSSWVFQGASGRWLRTTILPYLARLPGGNATVTALLLDPRNHWVCQQHANSGFSDRGIGDDLAPHGDAREIQASTLATVYLLEWYSVHYDVRCTIGLLDTFGPQRYDVGATGLMITVARREEPAILAPQHSWLYSVVRRDLDHTSHTAPTLCFQDDGDRPLRQMRPNAPTGFPPRADIDGDVVCSALTMTTVGTGRGRPIPLLTHYADPAAMDFDHIALLVRRSI